MQNSKIKIGVVSLGLIGSSILKGLFENKNYEFYCYSRSSFEKAKEFCKFSSDELSIVKDCDIVFVCSPISKTLSVLKKLNDIVKSSCVVCDVASCKNELLDKKFNFNFILSHPMAGSEKSGFEAGNKDLFKGAKWLIEKNNQLLEKVICDLGANILLIDMKNHDRMCAQISHCPTMLSYLVFLNAQDFSKPIASSGFRDMTRLACGDLTLSLDMIKYNEKNIDESLDELIEKIEKFKKMSLDEKLEMFKKVKEQRAKMYDKFGKNKYIS